MTMTQGRAAAAVLVLLTGACFKRGTSSGSSSSGGTPDFSTYAAFCKSAYGQSYCSPMPCMPFDQARCLTAYNALCDQLGAEIDAEIAAGKIVYNPQGSGACSDFYNRVFGLRNEYVCGDLDGYNAALWEVYGYNAQPAPLQCDHGVPAVSTYGSSPFSACTSLLVGQVPVNGSCGASSVCASGTCGGQPDGGCGLCSGAGTNGTGVDEGGSCVEHGDGGSRSVYCKSTLICDYAGSEKCLAYAGASQPCGAGFKLCAPGCGYACTGVDGGRGTCEALPGPGGHCGYTNGYDHFTYCQRGLACVATSDGGYLVPPNVACTPQAAVGSPCSNGTNYDAYNSPDYSGAYSNGYLTVCVTGATCAIADGGATGTCVAVGSRPETPGPPAATGQHCESASVNPCAATGDICNRADVCVPRNPEGGPCADNADECQVGLWCRKESDGGMGQCARPIADGQPCTLTETCAVLSTCFRDVCTPIDQYVYERAPLCQ